MRALSLAAAALISALASFTGVPLAGARSGCAELGGNVQSGNICHVRSDTPGYGIDVRFDTDYPDEQPVIDYLTQDRENVINAAQRPGAQNLPYHIFVTSTTYRSGQPTRTIPQYGQPWHGTQSLVLRDFHNYDPAPVVTKYKSFTFDFDHNRPVTFESLFAPGTHPIDSIYPAVATELARHFLERQFHLAPGIGRDPAIYQNFAITDDAVIFFFDTGELLEPEAGDYFAPVARANLPPLQL